MFYKTTLSSELSFISLPLLRPTATLFLLTNCKLPPFHTLQRSLGSRDAQYDSVLDASMSLSGNCFANLLLFPFANDPHRQPLVCYSKTSFVAFFFCISVNFPRNFLLCGPKVRNESSILNPHEDRVVGQKNFFSFFFCMEDSPESSILNPHGDRVVGQKKFFFPSQKSIQKVNNAA